MKGNTISRTNKVPIRMCVACRVKKPKNDLTRFIVSANELTIDDTMIVQTRGSYVCSTTCLEKYRKRRNTKLTKRKD